MMGLRHRIRVLIGFAAVDLGNDNDQRGAQYLQPCVGAPWSW